MKNPKEIKVVRLKKEDVKGSFFKGTNKFIKPSDYGSAEPIIIGKRNPIHAAFVPGHEYSVKSGKFPIPDIDGIWLVHQFEPKLNGTIIGLMKF